MKTSHLILSAALLALMSWITARPAQATEAALTVADVEKIIAQVVQEANARNTPAMIAVVDRVGNVLAVYRMAAVSASATVNIISNPRGANGGLNGASIPISAAAIAKALTGAYLSSDQNAFSTRTASQIIQDHFNPGVSLTASGPLYGVQFSQLPCSDMQETQKVVGAAVTTQGPHASPLGLAADPGGLPLYKNNQLVGGVGVMVAGSTYGLDTNVQSTASYPSEILAVAGTYGYTPTTTIQANAISVGGLSLRYSNTSTNALAKNPANASAYAALGGALVTVTGYFNSATPLAGNGIGSTASGFVQDTSTNYSTTASTKPYLLVNSAGTPRFLNADSTGKAGTAPGGGNSLTSAETTAILKAAYAVALQTRAQIRNPIGSQAAVTMSVVDSNGNILGIISTADVPMFGIDVSLQKARSAVFFSNSSSIAALSSAGLSSYTTAFNSFFGTTIGARAWSARAIGNIERDTFPDGFDGFANGPLGLSTTANTPFNDGLQEKLVETNISTAATDIANGTADADTHCTTATTGGVTILANGLQIFPGGFPIYRGSTLIGGIGVSGDGVTQDDMVSGLGLYNATSALKSSNPGTTPPSHAAGTLRAGTLNHNGFSPQYQVCPPAPFLNGSSQNVCGGI